jgi:transcriptional regulator with XRE-family HTH domain
MYGRGSSHAEIAERIREELGRRRLTRQWLADSARIGLSTLEKALSGQRPFTLGTLVRIETALDLRLRADGEKRPGGEVAPDELGAYARPAVRWLVGDYVTVRPAFETEGALYAYLTTIGWSEERACLVFAESGRLDADYAQRGDVAFPHQSGHIYLVTQETGQFRLVILGRPARSGALYGLLSTLQARGGSLFPLSCPIALLPAGPMAEGPSGLIRPGDAAYDTLAAHLARVEREGFARLLPMPSVDAPARRHA